MQRSWGRSRPDKLEKRRGHYAWGRVNKEERGRRRIKGSHGGLWVIAEAAKKSHFSNGYNTTFKTIKGAPKVALLPIAGTQSNKDPLGCSQVPSQLHTVLKSCLHRILISNF